MKNTPDNIPQLIEALGGAMEIAAGLGFPDKHWRVRQWKNRGRAPVAYWLGLLSLANQRDVPLDEKTLTKWHTTL
jgi:hypothetical protein